jgi:hypothetical protein
VRRRTEPMLHCPYCYAGFTAGQIEFRCPGPAQRGCRPEPDPVLSEHTGRPESLPPAFAARRPDRPAACPHCGRVSSVRICPDCHRRLPAKFGDIPSYLIALVGAKESGKTVFLTVLVHELMHELGADLNASLGPADDHTAHEFASVHDTPLYRGSRVLQQPTAASPGDRAPLVFRFTLGRPGHSRLAAGRGSRPTSALLALFDPGGEDFWSQQSVERNARYLAAVDGIVLLLDPLRMPAARELATPGTRLPSEAGLSDTPRNVLQNVTDLLLRTSPARPDGLISKPLAVAFSKIDAFEHSLPDGSPLRQPPAPYYNEPDSQRVHAEVLRLLIQWDGSAIDRTSAHHYASYRYSALSALGETPTPDNLVSGRGIHPYRVFDPLAWMLNRFGVLPEHGG